MTDLEQLQITARKGDADAQFQLVLRYDNAEGVEQSDDEAEAAQAAAVEWINQQ